jgi:pilus assembly protein Flp/PilA
MIKGFWRLLGDGTGATAVEYGLIVSLIVIAMLSALGVVANGTIDLWAFVGGAVQNAGQVG